MTQVEQFNNCNGKTECSDKDNFTHRKGIRLSKQDEIKILLNTHSLHKHYEYLILHVGIEHLTMQVVWKTGREDAIFIL